MSKVFNLVGRPFPTDHQIITDDSELMTKLKKISDLVEIKSDINEAKKAIGALELSFKNTEKVASIFMFEDHIVNDSLLAFAFVQYAKAFNRSTGRKSLSGEVKKIFSNSELLEIHEYIIRMRNTVFAHRESDHNKYHVMCVYYNNNDKVRLQTDSNVKRVLLAMSLKEYLPSFREVFCHVIDYLEEETHLLCRNIENNLLDEQKSLISNNPNFHYIQER
ncbi:MAG: hypothetical protein CSA45_04345 [Gammaproteobacteria bacterium]|nr:MAG: hypothetical protein CSA45_04345 [Gammaproteobacteria bacterium]